MDHPTRHLPDEGEPADNAPAAPTRRLPPTPPTRRCRACGGEVRRFRPVIQGVAGPGRLEIENQDAPPSLQLGRRPSSPCSAWVCLACGYTEFYTATPTFLLQTE